MAPRTETGKLFVLVYTIPGMLIMMSYLNIFSTCILIILRKVNKVVAMVTIAVAMVTLTYFLPVSSLFSERFVVFNN